MPIDIRARYVFAPQRAGAFGLAAGDAGKLLPGLVFPSWCRPGVVDEVPPVRQSGEGAHRSRDQRRLSTV